MEKPSNNLPCFFNPILYTDRAVSVGMVSFLTGGALFWYDVCYSKTGFRAGEKLFTLEKLIFWRME